MIDGESLKSRILKSINKKSKESEKLKNMMSSASYTKKDIKKYFREEFIKNEINDMKEAYSQMLKYGKKPIELRKIENLIKLENGEADDDDFKKEDLPPFKRTINLEKRNFLKKLGIGAIGFLGALAAAKADVLINANGVFKNGVEYSMGGIPYRIVAASDASDESKQKADYVCDGTNDEVEIRDSINDLPGQGGIIFFTEGTFSIQDNVRPSIPNSITLIGSGTDSTNLTFGYNLYFFYAADIFNKYINAINMTLSTNLSGAYRGVFIGGVLIASSNPTHIYISNVKFNHTQSIFSLSNIQNNDNSIVIYNSYINTYYVISTDGSRTINNIFYINDIINSSNLYKGGLKYDNFINCYVSPTHFSYYFNACWASNFYGSEVSFTNIKGRGSYEFAKFFDSKINNFKLYSPNNYPVKKVMFRNCIFSSSGTIDFSGVSEVILDNVVIE